MIPKTLSATSVHVAELCLRRWEAQYDSRIAVPHSTSAATLGTTVHAALEQFVTMCFMGPKEKRLEPSMKNLKTFFVMAWKDNFDGIDTDDPMYTDGLQMLEVWFSRSIPALSTREVISCELKTPFDLPTSVGVIPFNYIFDRFDRLNNLEFEVIDYKTQRWGLKPEDLKKKVQPRVYALAASIQLKAQGIPYDKIWVRFDLLRHDSVATSFTREENIATWKRLVEVAERIISTDAADAKETLNDECLFCPVKATCPSLLKNIAGGGIHSLEFDDLLDRRGLLEAQAKAVKSAISELDEFIMDKARGDDVDEYETEKNRVYFAMSRRRTVDGGQVEQVVGPKLFELYGGYAITIEKFNQLTKDKSLTPEQIKQLKGLIGYSVGDPRVKIESRGFSPD